jgi:hypothetical protein
MRPSPFLAWQRIDRYVTKLRAEHVSAHSAAASSTQAIAAVSRALGAAMVFAVRVALDRLTAFWTLPLPPVSSSFLTHVLLRVLAGICPRPAISLLGAGLLASVHSKVRLRVFKIITRSSL